MTDQPIANESEYTDALAELGRLLEAAGQLLMETDADDTGLDARIEALAARILAYETVHYPRGDS